MRERFMVFLRCFVVNASRFLGCFVSSDSNSFPVDHNANRVQALLGAPSHAPESAHVVAAHPTILRVFDVRTFAQILSAVVQSVMVFVVAFFSRFQSENHTVHGYRLSAFILRRSRTAIESVVSAPISAAGGEPIPLRKPIKIGSINYRVLALRKWNKTVGLVERLNNLVSFHGELHGSSSKGLVNFSRYLTIILLLFIAPLAFSQNTTVSGQVTDSGAQSWNSGTVTYKFNPVPSYNGPYSLAGGAFNPVTTYSTTMNASGAYSALSVPTNTAITPSGSSWTVTVCPQATSPCYNTSVILNTGTQTVNVTPPAISVTPGANVSVYSTSEVAGAAIGSQVYLIGTGLQLCGAVTGTTCTTWNTAGGSSGGGLPSGIASPLCNNGVPGVQITGSFVCGFIYNDGLPVSNTVTTTLNGSTITVPGGNLTALGSTVTGMIGWVTNTAQGYPSAPTCPASTFTVVDATHLTFTAANDCTATLTATGTLVIGHQDGANLTAAWTALGCGDLHLPTTSNNLAASPRSGAYIITNAGQWNTNTPSPYCTGGAPTNGYYAGNSVEGGIASTNIILSPDFAWNTTNCPLNNAIGVCFGSALANMRGIYIEAFGMTTCGSTQLIVVQGQGGGRAESVNVSNICWVGSGGNTNLTGMAWTGGNYHMSQGGVQFVGSVDCWNRDSGGSGYSNYSYASSCNNVSASNGGGLSVAVGSSLTDTNSVFYNNVIGGNLISTGGIFQTTSVSGTFQHYGGQDTAGAFVGSAYSNVAIYCNGASGNIVLNGNTIAMPAANGAGLWLFTSGCKAAVQNTKWTGVASANPVVLVAGTVFQNQGGNTPPNFGTSLFANSGQGQIIADGHSAAGTGTGTCTSSTTLFLRTTGINTAGAVMPTTCTATTADVGQRVSGARVIWGMTVTATHAGFSASSGVVTLLKNGSATALTCTIGTGTTCTDSNSAHYVTCADGDLITFQVTTQATEVLAGLNAFAMWD